MLFAAAAQAQEGHPLSGTWSGERASASGDKVRLTLVMEWNGKQVTGTINPGPDAVPLERVTVDYDKWTVRIEAKGITFNGKLEDLGSWHRTLSGQWATGPTLTVVKFRRD